MIGSLVREKDYYARFLGFRVELARLRVVGRLWLDHSPITTLTLLNLRLLPSFLLGFRDSAAAETV